MNSKQAKEILAAFRPGTEDERDPVFTEALALAEHDPDLAVWLKEQQAFDAAVSRRAQAFTVPPALLEEIRVSVKKRRQTRLHRRSVLTALAACLAFSTTLAVYWWFHRIPSEVNQFAVCRRDMVAFLLKFPRLDLETVSVTEARRWLADTHHLQQIEIPVRLLRFPTIGCRTILWHGQSLALVCFMVDGEVVHLILLPRGINADQLTATPQFARVAGVSTIAWSRGDLTYLLISKVSEDFLRQRL
jgi:hypothetical protein